MRRACFALLLGAVLTPWAAAQTQPAEASNAQDEYINVDLAPDGTGDLSGAMTFIRTPNTFADNQYIARVFELVCSPFEILPYVRTLVATEGGTTTLSEYVNPDGVRRYRINVVCPPYQMPYVEQIISAFNEPGFKSNQGGIRFHLRAHNRLASELASILRRTEISGDGQVQSDDVTNTVYIFDSDSDGNRALNVMHYYDVPPRMVELEVQILEIDLGNSQQLGLDWDAWKTSAAGYVSLAGAARDSLGGEFFSFDTLLLTDVTSVAEFLNYLVHVGHASVITHTSLVAVNGQPAILESSLHVPDLQYAPEEGADPIPVVDDDAEFNQDNDVVIAPHNAGRSVLRDRGLQQEGFTLTFTPTIGTDSMTCAVECLINSLVRQNDLDQPLVAERRTDTVITLADGNPCLIGAFDQTRQLQVQDGFPLLRRIPYLGQSLFSEWTDETRSTKMVVLVTPHVNQFLQYNDDAIMYGERVPDPDFGDFSGLPATTPEPYILDSMRQAEEMGAAAAQQASDAAVVVP
jgi:hypothetical protein